MCSAKTNGTSLYSPFMEIKDYEGEWMQNVQYPGGWYFERAPKAEKGDKKDDKKKKK
jgi:hypothetical protein